MRESLSGYLNIHYTKAYRKKQDKNYCRAGASIWEQGMTRNRAYLTVAIMGFAVGVMMQRNNSQKNQRQGDADEGFKCSCSGKGDLLATHI